MEYCRGGVPPEAEILIDPESGIIAVVVVIVTKRAGGSEIVSGGKADKQDNESLTRAV